ncbi:UNVERIFIED_CONTAM: hypothetical protein K2H54_000497 [Gekko kuhli]
MEKQVPAKKEEIVQRRRKGCKRGVSAVAGCVIVALIGEEFVVGASYGAKNTGRYVNTFKKKGKKNTEEESDSEMPEWPEKLQDYPAKQMNSIKDNFLSNATIRGSNAP